MIIQFWSSDLLCLIHLFYACLLELYCIVANVISTKYKDFNSFSGLLEQMINKDGTINQLQGDIQSYDKELTSTRGILSKVTQERDLMWQEVKQYSEKNMLLNREVESLKKKVEALEEDTLLKDGQISILKDSLNNAKPFNILFQSEQFNEF